MPSSSFSFARHDLTNSSSDSTRSGNFLCGQETGSGGGECGDVWKPVSSAEVVYVLCCAVILRKTDNNHMLDDYLKAKSTRKYDMH